MAAECLDPPDLQPRRIAQVVADGGLQDLGRILEIGDHADALAHQGMPAKLGTEGHVVAHQREGLAAAQAVGQRSWKRVEVVGKPAYPEAVVEELRKDVDGTLGNREAVVDVDDTRQRPAVFVVEGDYVGPDQGAADGKSNTHPRNAAPVVAGGQEVEFAVTGEGTVFEGEACGVGVDLAMSGDG